MISQEYSQSSRIHPLTKENMLANILTLVIMRIMVVAGMFVVTLSYKGVIKILHGPGIGGRGQRHFHTNFVGVNVFL